MNHKKILLAFLIIVCMICSSVFSAVEASRPDNNVAKKTAVYTQDLLDNVKETDVSLALILLSSQSNKEMKDSIVFIKMNGGKILHTYPTHILISQIPKSLAQTLVGKASIIQIFFDSVDLSVAEKYGELAKLGVEAWNNNFKGQAASKGLTPPISSKEQPPIQNDTRIKPEPVKREMIMPTLPYGASFYDTSEYMMGSVSVGIIFPESTGQIDPNQENWQISQISSVNSEITAGLNWWATKSQAAHLSFTYHTIVVPTSYEPINRASWNEEGLWISDVMQNQGYFGGDYFEQVYSYLNYIRNIDETDWAVAIFVINSNVDADGKFPDGYFGYAYFGGPFIVMTYDNDGYGIASMDAVVAHEFGHIFYAADEYYTPGYNNPGLPTEKYGYLAVENQNLQGSGSSNVGCIMRGGTLSYQLGQICFYTQGHIGWRDSNNNGIFDIIDFPNTNTLFTSLSEISNDQTPTFFGTISCTACYPNSNPLGWRHDITINKITTIKYRIYPYPSPFPIYSDNVAITENQLDSQVLSYEFTAPALNSGVYLFEVYSENLAGQNIFGPSIMLTIDILPPNSPTLISPSNRASLPSNKVTFNWASSDTDIIEYIFELDTSSSFNSANKIRYFISETSHMVTLPSQNGVWYWRVCAKDAAQNLGNYSQVWTFTLNNTIKSFDMALSTDKDRYVKWSYVSINVGITDRTSKISLQGVAVNVTIYDTHNRIAFTATGITNQDGIAKFTYKLFFNAQMGNYRIIAFATLSGYQQSNIQKTFYSIG